MKPEDIARWRPKRLNDFCGRRNRASGARVLRRIARYGRLASPLLLVAPFGYGKTSLARLLLKGINCAAPIRDTGDPCGDCEQCLSHIPSNNGTGFPFLRLEVDCTQSGRPEIIALCRDYRFDRNAAIFLDELHRLHEKNSQEPLLKFLEDFPGQVIAAVMEDRYRELIPPLRERFETLWLEPPTESEVVDFLVERCADDWRIDAPVPVIRSMVGRTGVSFRHCQRLIAAAAGCDPRRLDHELLDHYLGAASETREPKGEPRISLEAEDEFLFSE